MILNNCILIVSIFFLVLKPIGVYAQDEDLVFSADRVTVQSKDILRANGNVKIQNGETIIKAEEVIINKSSNVIEFSGIKEFSDGVSTELEAEAAILDETLSIGVISAANILINDKIKIKADRVTLKNGIIETAKNISQVTSCEICKNQTPNWHFSSSSAERDAQNLNIVYRDVVLRVKGKPIAYLPYLRLPDPSVDRAPGFLVPEAFIASNLGAGIKLPYFVPIGQSRDVLVTPFLTPKTTTFEFRYRQNLGVGGYKFSGAISADEIIKGKTRYFYNLEGDFKLTYGLKLGVKFGQASDKLYMADYSYGDSNEIESKIALDKILVDETRFFEGAITYVRDKDDESSLNEYYSIEGHYKKYIEQNLLSGNLYLDAGINSSLNINEDNSFSRAPSSAKININYNENSFFGPVRNEIGSYISLNSFVNAEDNYSSSEDLVFQYGISSRAYISFAATLGSITSIITPNINLSANGQQGRASGDFFIGADELSVGNFKASKRYSSLSESELGVSSSFGIDQDFKLKDDLSLNVSLGALRIGKSTNNSNRTAGLKVKKLSYITAFDLKREKNSFLSGTSLISNEGKLLSGYIRSKHTSPNFNLITGYEYLDKESDIRLVRSLQNLNFSTSYSFWNKLKLGTDGRFDFNENKPASAVVSIEAPVGNWNYKFSKNFSKTQTDLLSLSAIYEDECTLVKIAFEKRYQELESLDTVETITFRVQFRPFAKFVVSQGLNREIPFEAIF